MVEVTMKIMAHPSKCCMHALLHSVPLTLQQAIVDLLLHQRLLYIHRQVWVSPLWGHWSFLLGPGAHKVLFVPSKSLFPQSHVSSGSSMVGLMETSSREAYAISRSAAPRAPAPVAGHCWLVPPQETLKHSSGSVSSVGSQGLWVLVRTRFVWALWASLAHNTKIRLIIFFEAKDAEALYREKKQDQGLTVAQIMNSLL